MCASAVELPRSIFVLPQVNWRSFVTVGSAPSGRGFSRHRGSIDPMSFSGGECPVQQGTLPRFQTWAPWTHQVIPEHGCIPAVPAPFHFAEDTLAVFDECANIET